MSDKKVQNVVSDKSLEVSLNSVNTVVEKSSVQVEKAQKRNMDLGVELLNKTTDYERTLREKDIAILNLENRLEKAEEDKQTIKLVNKSPFGFYVEAEGKDAENIKKELENKYKQEIQNLQEIAEDAENLATSEKATLNARIVEMGAEHKLAMLSEKTQNALRLAKLQENADKDALQAREKNAREICRLKRTILDLEEAISETRQTASHKMTAYIKKVERILEKVNNKWVIKLLDRNQEVGSILKGFRKLRWQVA